MSCLTRQAAWLLGRSTLAAVIGLRLSAGPSAILGSVVAVVVNAVKRHSVWAFSHVITERIKGHPPPFTDLDSPSTIPFEVTALWIAATLDHVLPTRVHRRNHTILPTRMLAFEMPRWSTNGTFRFRHASNLALCHTLSNYLCPLSVMFRCALLALSDGLRI